MGARGLKCLQVHNGEKYGSEGFEMFTGSQRGEEF